MVTDVTIAVNVLHQVRWQQKELNPTRIEYVDPPLYHLRVGTLLVSAFEFHMCINFRS
jgi:hypothetical protein